MVWMEAVAVDQDVLRADCKEVKCAVHACYRCVEDVYTVNLFSTDHDDCPCEGVFFNVRSELPSFFLRQLFAVVESGAFESFGQYYGSACHRSAQATPSGFIASGFGNPGIQVWFESVQLLRDMI